MVPVRSTTVLFLIPASLPLMPSVFGGKAGRKGVKLMSGYDNEWNGASGLLAEHVTRGSMSNLQKVAEARLHEVGR